MQSQIIHCADPEIKTSIVRWIDGLKLNVSHDISLDVRLGSPGPTRDPRAPFRQPGVEIRSGPPSPALSITWTVAPARAIIPNGAPHADLTISNEAWQRGEIFFNSFMHAVLIFLLRRRGLHHIHAANVQDPDGRGWLFVGNARDGKSTTAALLASRGWAVAGDDATFLTLEGGTVVAAESPGYPLALRDSGRRLLNTGGGIPIKQQKSAFFPEDLGGTWIPRTVPRVLVFPTVGDSRSRAGRLTRTDALKRLIRWSAWVALERELAAEHLNILNVLAAQAAAFELRLGSDLVTDPRLLENLISC